MNDVDTRLELLETKLAYQEEAISQLNDALVGQQRELMRLTELSETLRAKLVAMSESSGADPDAQEMPPHY